MHIWLGGVVGYFAESQFSPIFCKTLLFLKDLAPRDEAQVHQQFFLSQILLYENYDEILPSILVQLLEVVHHRGHG